MIKKRFKDFQKEDEKSNDEVEVDIEVNTEVDEDEVKKKYKAFFRDIDSIKFDEEYTRLKDIVKINEARQSKDKIVSVLDDICYDTKIAGYLYVRAKKEYITYEKLDYEIWMSKKRNEAIIEGGMPKSASIEKIDDWIKQKYSKEYKSRTEKLLNLKMVRDALEIFYEQFNSRKSILQSQNKILG